ncbi:EAL domain-containing protein [Sphingomonas sp. MMS24-JH45]
MIRHAQVAMKKSKTSKAAEAYQTFALDSAREEFAMETALRRAIESDQLNMVFQPICDLATGRVELFEALARWTDEAGRRYEPTRFIQVAEELGLIVPLGRWAIEHRGRTLADWDLRCGDCGVRVVNVSPRSRNDWCRRCARRRIPGCRVKG